MDLTEKVHVIEVSSQKEICVINPGVGVASSGEGLLSSRVEVQP
jgi:hypothetical protein